METEHRLPAQEVVALPASYAQQRIWFLERFEQDGAPYNLPLIKRLRGALDVDALERALVALVERHEPLRTVFTVIDGAPHQVVAAPGLPEPLHVIDLRGEPDAEARALALVDEQARQRFDLAVDRPLRSALIKLADDDHILTLTLHHIAADGWSVDVLSKELSLLYGAFLQGRLADLPELPIQYADYAVWQREWIDGGGLDQQLQYWKAQLSDAPALLELPSDRPRPARQSFEGATVREVLPAELLSQVKALAAREGKTLFMTLLAAFVTLLHRYSRQEDLVVASPVAGRNRVELEGLIGFFVNTLALRTRLHDDPSFRQLLQRVQETALGAFANQDLPFEKLVEELNPQRSLSYPPIAQVMFMFQTGADRPVEMPGLDQERLVTERGTAKFDLTLSTGEVPDGLRVALEYCTDLFDEPTARRMLKHFRALLEAVVADPDRPLSMLSLLDAAERHQLQIEWNDTRSPYPQKCLHELFAEQARKTPAAIAVEFEEDRLTYGELDARANQLAHHLISLGIGRDVLVGISVERSLEMLVGLLGTLKAGGAYVPIDPAYPAERQQFMLASSQARVLLTQEHLAAAIHHGGEVVCLDRDWPAIALRPATPPAASADPDQLAYVIYTSGSTGEPKGVEIPHRALVNFLSAMQERPGLSETDVLLAVTTLSFDIAGLEVYLPLITGARVVIAPTETISDPVALADLLERSGATVMQATPTTWRMLVDSGWPGIAGMKALCGGEPLPRALADGLLSLGLELWNMYGPTETTIWSSCAQVTTRGEPLSIGRPIDNTMLYILDRHLAPVPVGVPGELWIGGDGLARGYRGRPDLTAERFIADPFAASLDARIYRTGDLARYRADGSVEFLGRVDQQVKVRGYRIELGEIETVLSRHPAVREAVVAIRGGSGPEAQLAAYLIPSNGSIPVPELRKFVQRTLPEYMVPAAFVTLSAFPLTPNGKVDRKALPAPAAKRELDHAFTAPRNALEQSVAEIWANLLRLDRVGVHDNFFALGGHSLRATQLVSRLREMFGVELSVRAVFEAPTVAGLAAEVQAARGQPVFSEYPPLQPDSRRAGAAGSVVLPASFAQQRLWFLDQLEGFGTAAYNAALSTRLHGALETSALERALNALVARHEALRTTFTVIDGVPHQVIGPPQPLTIRALDLRGRPDAEEAALELVDQDAAAPFELSSGPLLRVMLIALADDDHILHLTLHHTVLDGWSTGVINRELSLLYCAYRAGAEPDLPELQIQYGDYAAWQQEWMRSGGFDRQLDYWELALSGAPVLLELPTDRPRRSRQSFRGAIVRKELPRELLERVAELAEREGATLFMALLAAYATLLARYSGQDDIVVASPIANRSRVELEDVVGLFVNTIALRTKVDASLGFRELLRRVRENSIDAFAHQDVPFEKLVEKLNPERHLAHSPIAQVMFALQRLEATLELPGITRTHVPRERTTAIFDQFLSATETRDGLRLSLEYCTDLFEEDTARRMLDHYATLLEAAVADPEREVGALPLLSDVERRQILFDFNDTATAYPPAVPVHELVAKQVRSTPSATAVTYAGEELTYQELDRRANQLAQHLQAMGVGPDVVVAVAADRSLHTVVAVLAILKAGGAYAPVDPHYPAERVAFMLEDTDTPVLLTQRHLLEQLPTHRGETLCLDDPDLYSGSAGSAPASGVTAENLAYVIYTSGSTGRPKGVAMPHRTLANLLAWQLERFVPAAAARTLQFASLSFDVAFQEIFSTWASGGTLVLVSEGERRDPHALLTLLREQQIERLFLPFVGLENLCEEAQRSDVTISTLREVITAGEQLKCTPAIRRFFARHPGCRLDNQYGPTESHVVTAFELGGAPDEWPPLPPIGRPIANAKAHILDSRGEPVPIGVRGELCLGGAALARGYLGRPDLTAERFMEDPFAEEPRIRLYWTGDLARYRADGNIEFLGRGDHQVKVRGYRIEPGEVEQRLREHSAVREALVVAGEAPNGEKRLVAYVVPEDAARDAGELRAFLARTLPEYMIPSAFVSLGAFPLTPNGKVDRHALPHPAEDAIARSTYVEPSTDLERSLVAIWQTLLEVEPIGVDDDFFDLGGHSLLAVQLVRRVEEQLRGVCTLPMLFRNRTIRRLAAEMHVGGPGVTEPTVLPLQPDGQEPALFCIGGVHVYQELADALAPEVPVYGVFLPSEQELFEVERGERHVRRLSVEELAAAYVEVVREQQPHGPYLLTGLCFGGLVAYEAAQQLTRAGEEVAMLVMCDTVLASARRSDFKANMIRLRYRSVRRARAAVNGVRRRLGLRPPTSEIQRLAAARARIYGEATRRYRVRPYGGEVVLVRPAAILAGRQRLVRNMTFGWDEHVARLEICDVPGDHGSHLRRPNVNVLLSALRPRIAAARNGYAGAPSRRRG